MALIGKSANDGDLRGRNRRFQQQRFCLLDPAQQQPFMRRHARCHAKRAREVAAREPARLCYVRYEDITAQIARQILLRALFLTQGKSTGPNGFALDEPAIALTEMCREGERDLIDKQRAGFVGAVESR
jgi:hypothetical protein